MLTRNAVPDVERLRSNISVPLRSIVLDLTRFLLALLVAIGHWTQPFFQEGWQDRTAIAVACVGGFFVLSGFTIRMLTPVDVPVSARSFYVERLSRLWSVALPALVLTAVLDGLSYLVNPPYYMTHWGDEAESPLKRLLLNVVFAGQLWGHDVSPLSNSLFWSLSYEAGFYLLYGVFKATRGAARLALCLLTAAVLGPNIVLMLVPWIAGVFLYDAHAWVRLESPRKALLAARVAAAASVLSGAFAVWVWRAWRRGIIETLDTWLKEGCRIAGVSLGHVLPGLEVRPARVDGSLLLGAFLFFLVFGPAMLLCRASDHLAPMPAGLVRWARRLGDFTFPLYLFHFPIFVLVGAVAFYDRRSGLQKGAIFCAVVTAIFFVSPSFGRLKLFLRRNLNEWLPSRS